MVTDLGVRHLWNITLCTVNGKFLDRVIGRKFLFSVSRWWRCGIYESSIHALTMIATSSAM
jgi:hypothetical protein